MNHLNLNIPLGMSPEDFQRLISQRVNIGNIAALQQARGISSVFPALPRQPSKPKNKAPPNKHIQTAAQQQALLAARQQAQQAKRSEEVEDDDSIGDGLEETVYRHVSTAELEKLGLRCVRRVVGMNLVHHTTRH